jgi:hypothetical protein
MTETADDAAAEPVSHVHDWRVLKTEEVANPSSGPSAYGWQTVVLLRCAVCGDVAGRVLPGRCEVTDPPPGKPAA